MKILTIVSILLLPGALLAGIAGMNVDFKAAQFFVSGLSWAVIVAVIVIAVSTVGFARQRHWI